MGVTKITVPTKIIKKNQDGPSNLEKRIRRLYYFLSDFVAYTIMPHKKIGLRNNCVGYFNNCNYFQEF